MTEPAKRLDIIQGTVRAQVPDLPPPSVDPLMMLIERVACDPTADVGKMRELLEMHQSLQARQAEKQYAEAMSQAQQEMEPIRTDCLNKQNSSKYASYAALDRALRPIYTKHGFAPSFDTEPGAPADMVRVICDVSHRDGHTRRYRLDMPADGKGAKGGDVMTKTHATGSALTYGQRYLLKMIFNIAVETDDDGNRAAASSAPVSEKQLNELIALADAVEANKSNFCKYLSKRFRIEIKGFAEIPAAKFADAKQALERKGAQ